MRLIDADSLLTKVLDASYYDNQDEDVVWYMIQSLPTINPEELPIVKELRGKLEETKKDRDEANKTAQNWKYCWEKELERRKEAEKKLARYEQAEKDGRLIDLPCKVGDKVYLPRGFHGFHELLSLKILPQRKLPHSKRYCLDAHRTKRLSVQSITTGKRKRKCLLMMLCA